MGEAPRRDPAAFVGKGITIGQRRTGWSHSSLELRFSPVQKMKHLLLSVLSLLPLFGCTKDPITKVVMHREMATHPVENGWHLAESTEGSSSVLMPMPFNDFTVVAEDQNFGTVRTFVIGKKSDEGFKFSVTEMPLENGMKDPDLKSLSASFEKEGSTVMDLVADDFLGHESISFAVTGRRSGAFVRYVKTGHSLITMVIEYPSDRHGEILSFKAPFFSSLKLKTQNR